MSDYIKALLTEREGYLRRGRADRVAQVDAALRELGYENDQLSASETATVEPATERSVRKKAAKKRGE